MRTRILYLEEKKIKNKKIPLGVATEFISTCLL